MHAQVTEVFFLSSSSPKHPTGRSGRSRILGGDRHQRHHQDPHVLDRRDMLRSPPHTDALVQSEQPDHLLLIGNKGKLDTLIYGEMRASFPSLLVTTPIHKVYSVSSEKEPGAPLRFG